MGFPPRGLLPSGKGRSWCTQARPLLIQLIAARYTFFAVPENSAVFSSAE